MTRTTVALVLAAWVAALPLMLLGWGGLLEWAKRIGRRSTEAERQPLELVQPTLGEQLRADQRRHVAHWANHEGDDVA
jgi:hypothetical protein